MCSMVAMWLSNPVTYNNKEQVMKKFQLWSKRPKIYHSHKWQGL